MATYHLTAKIGQKGKAQPHAAYIAREGKYSGSNRYEDLEATDYGNMPTWAEHNPAEFWQAADQHERANGSTYRELEIALPRELTPPQRLELVQAFITQELGEKHAYQFAIHTPKAAIEKGEQPHAHIMYSERIRDGIERDPEQYFKRYNAKNPDKGGAKKFRRGNGMAEVKAELSEQRERWATLQNAHLEKHGHDSRVDHRSLKDQGAKHEPEKHLGGAGVRDNTKKEKLLEMRAAQVGNTHAQAQAERIIREGKLEQEKRKQEQQKAQEKLEIRRKAAERAEEIFNTTMHELELKRQRERAEEKERLRTPAEWEKLANDELVKIFVEERGEWRKGENKRLLGEAETTRAQAWALKAEEPSKFGGLFVTKKREKWETDLQQKIDEHSALKQQAQDAIDGNSPKEREQIRRIEDKAREVFKEKHPKLAQVLIDKATREQAEREEKQREQQQERERERQNQASKPKQKSRDWDMER